MDYPISSQSGGVDFRMITNKVVIILGLCALTYFNISAQEHSDIGLFAGTSYYMGELNPNLHYAAPSFAIGPIYRYNFNNYNSLRGHALYHKLSGADENFIGDSDVTSPAFAANFVNLGLDFEFNWNSYRTAHRKTKASPYVFAGLGVGLNMTQMGFGNASVPTGFNNSMKGTISPVHATIPFGFGYKINLGRWLSGGFEISGRKALSDKIDGISNPLGVGDEPRIFGNRDWYFFTGVFITYKFFKYWEDCPTYDNSHKY